MNRFLNLSALATAAVLVGVSAQAQSLQQDNAQAELGGVAVTPIVVKAKSTLPVYGGLTRAAVTAELARARAAGEMDFAAAEVNGGVVPQRGSVSASELRLAGRQAQ